MKRIVFLLLSLVLGLSSAAQSANYAPGKVAFCPIYDTAFSGWPQEITELMQNKLTQIVMQNGVGSFSDQYVLTAKVALEDKQVTATAPAQYMVKLSVQLQAIDADAQVLIRELTLSMTGVDRSENRAYLAAIRQIKPNNPQIKTFINEASNAAVAAYNRNLTAYLQEARDLEASGYYNDALCILAQIPSNVDRYEEVMTLSSEIVARQTKSQKAAAAIQAAKAAEKAEAEAEALQRERDFQIQQEMLAAMQQKKENENNDKLVAKVKQWFLGSLA